MISGIHRPAAVHVDLEAIQQNVKNEMTHLQPGQKLWAVVKANGYGHGAVQVARAAQAAGASGFCVALLDEGIELRRAGITAPILVLGIIPPEQAATAVAFDLAIPVGSLDWLQQVQPELQAAQSRLKIHLAIDSGMGRIGFSEDKAVLAADAFLQQHPEFEVEGLFTHFATADSDDLTYFDYQVTRFKHLRDLFTVKPKYVHVANTATSLFNRRVSSDLVRFGIGMYGLNPSSAPHSPELQPKITLKPALRLTSELSFVKQIHAGYGVGYGATHVAKQDEWIGTVPVGYADGWQRGMQGFKVKVGETYCPIVGRVCMDQFMVKLPKQFAAGTKVELISSDPTAPNSLKAVADYLGTIHYEVACLLTDRLPRLYD